MAAPDRYPYEQRLREFDRIIRSAQQTLVAQIEAAVRSGDLQTAHLRQAQFAAVSNTIHQLATDANPLASRAVEEAWQQGADRALHAIERLDVTAAERAPGMFAGVSTEAVQQLQLSLLDRLDSAQQTLGRKVQDIYAREQRRATLRAVLGASGSPDQASKDMQQRLMRDRHIRKAVAEGKGAFVDAAGRQWSLETYSNMAVRTVTREAVVQGAITRMTAHGIALARVSEHASPCPICAPFEGVLIDIAGVGITEYRGEAVSTQPPPPFHPNCEHSLEPVSALIDNIRAELAGAAA